jgi:hypothetical protein
MVDEFRRITARLWKSLGLASPKFRPEGTTTLTVDGFELKLALTEDGHHIAVSCKAGQLSANPALMEEQITRLLRSHLRTLPYNQAGCWLDEQDSPTPVVVVQATTPSNRASIDRLVGTIGDVAHLAGEYSRELGGRAAEPRARNESLPDDDMMIFRP